MYRRLSSLRYPNPGDAAVSASGLLPFPSKDPRRYSVSVPRVEKGLFSFDKKIFVGDGYVRAELGVNFFLDLHDQDHEIESDSSLPAAP